MKWDGDHLELSEKGSSDETRLRKVPRRLFKQIYFLEGFN